MPDQYHHHCRLVDANNVLRTTLTKHGWICRWEHHDYGIWGSGDRSSGHRQTCGKLQAKSLTQSNMLVRFPNYNQTIPNQLSSNVEDPKKISNMGAASTATIKSPAAKRTDITCTCEGCEGFYSIPFPAQFFEDKNNHLRHSSPAKDLGDWKKHESELQMFGLFWNIKMFANRRLNMSSRSMVGQGFVAQPIELCVYDMARVLWISLSLKTSLGFPMCHKTSK